MPHHRLPDIAIIAIISVIALLIVAPPDYYGGVVARIGTVLLIAAGFMICWLHFYDEPWLIKLFGYGGLSAILFLLQATAVDFFMGSLQVGLVSLVLLAALSAAWYFMFFQKVRQRAKER